MPCIVEPEDLNHLVCFVVSTSKQLQFLHLWGQAIQEQMSRAKAF